MKRFLQILVLLLLFAAQLAIPIMQAIRGEAILHQGAAFRLALQPVDPYDVLRGRYLALNFPESHITHTLPTGTKGNDILYAVLGNDANGIAHITRLSRTPEDNAFTYQIPADITNMKDFYIEIPLTRFYLPEEDAIAIDAVLNNQLTNESATQVTASLDVRVKDGQIVAESLWLDGRPYRDWLNDYVARHSHDEAQSKTQADTTPAESTKQKP